MTRDLSAAFALDADLDPSSVEVYERALRDTEASGFGYLQLRTAVQKMVAMGMSERDALASVFVTAETMGQDRLALLKNAEAHLATLEEERGKIRAAMTKRLTDGLAADRKAIAAEKQKQTDLREQIKDLERRLEDSAAEEARLQEDLRTIESRVEEQGQKLEAVYEAYHRAISADVAAMRG